MARRPNETSPTGQRSPSPTCAPACSRCAISSTRSSTRGAPTGTPPGMPSADRRSPQATSCRSSTRLTAGYQDSRWVLDAGGDVPRTRETAAGMALVDAQFLAALRRTIAHDHVQFDLRPYGALTPPQIEALDQAARRYGEYLRLKARRPRQAEFGARPRVPREDRGGAAWPRAARECRPAVIACPVASAGTPRR